MSVFTCRSDCPDRKPGCHDHCDKYQREKSEWDRRKAAVRAGNEAYSYTAGIVAKRTNAQAIKHKGNNGYKTFKGSY